MAHSLFITNISCHLAAPPHSQSTPLPHSSAISLIVSPHWPSLPSPWGTASLMSSTVVSRQSSAFCTNISITSTSPPLSPFLSSAKNTFSQPIRVASDHLQSSFLYPLTPSSSDLILFIFLKKMFVSSKSVWRPPRGSVTSRLHRCYSEVRGSPVCFQMCFALDSVMKTHKCTTSLNKCWLLRY